MPQARGSEFTSRRLASTRAALVFALVAAASATGTLIGCGAGNGDEELRPKILTPTRRSAQDVMQTPAALTPEMAALACPELVIPPSPPIGTPDENGYISGPPQQCNGPNLSRCELGTPAPMSGMLLDPTQYVMPAGTWGDASVGGLTGGTSLYSDAAPSNLTQSIVAGKLHVQAAITAGGYTGIVLWFGPCVNASAFDGVQFTATGELGGSSMIVKTQTSPDYPIDGPNTKGKCRFKVEANRFTECQQPTATLNTLPPGGAVTLPWSSFTGGVPEPEIDPDQLLGFELQFSCPATVTAGCALSVDLGTISFIPQSSIAQ